MTIVVTGVTGHFGRLAVESLLDRGVPADQIVATGRRVERLADLAERGVTVRAASYDDPAALRAAFAGADRLLFVSSSEAGARLSQHRAVVSAAQEAGIGLVAYTSAPHADTSSMLIAGDHVDTERALTESGLPHVSLRNGWYIENYDLKAAVEHGLRGASGDGRISLSTRADLAEAAATVISSDGHAGQVYELGGEAVTMAELAAEVSRQSGTDVTYTNLSLDDYVAFLVSLGLPRGFATVLADSDRGAAEGDLDVDPADLERLLGRPATPLADAVKAALA